jgi:hypothetical protein
LTDRQDSIRNTYLQQGRRIYTLLVFVVALLMATTGVAGYIIGKGSLGAASVPGAGDAQGRVYVSSLQPMDVPTTGFERISWMGSVVDGEGRPLPGLKLSLKGPIPPDGYGIIRPAYRNAQGFAYTELFQGNYHLLATWKGGQAALDLELRKTQKQGQAQLGYNPQNGYILTAYPSTGIIAMDLVLQNGVISPRLHQEEAIGLEVFQVWSHETQAHIFDERLGNYSVNTQGMMNYIAPGSNGTFIFAVHNPATYPVEYRIDLRHEDENTPALPMIFRMFKDCIDINETQSTCFLPDDKWRTAEELIVPSVWIPSQTVYFYTLQWQWDPSDDIIDTAIGAQPGRPLYRLWINVRQKGPELYALNH